MAVNKDISISESEFDLEKGGKGKITVFMYRGSGNPAVNLDDAVSSYVGDNNNYWEFIHSSLDNPWDRIIISNINDMKQYDFNTFIKNRDRRKKLKNLNNL